VEKDTFMKNVNVISVARYTAGAVSYNYDRSTTIIKGKYLKIYRKIKTLCRVDQTPSARRNLSVHFFVTLNVSLTITPCVHALRKS